MNLYLDFCDLFVKGLVWLFQLFGGQLGMLHIQTMWGGCHFDLTIFWVLAARDNNQGPGD